MRGPSTKKQQQKKNLQTTTRGSSKRIEKNLRLERTFQGKHEIQGTERKESTAYQNL